MAPFSGNTQRDKQTYRRQTERQIAISRLCNSVVGLKWIRESDDRKRCAKTKTNKADVDFVKRAPELGPIIGLSLLSSVKRLTVAISSELIISTRSRTVQIHNQPIRLALSTPSLTRLHPSKRPKKTLDQLATLTVGRKYCRPDERVKSFRQRLHSVFVLSLWRARAWLSLFRFRSGRRAQYGAKSGRKRPCYQPADGVRVFVRRRDISELIFSRPAKVPVDLWHN